MTAIGIYSKYSEGFYRMKKDSNIDNTAATYIFYKTSRNLYTLDLLYVLYENKGVDIAVSNELLS